MTSLSTQPKRELSKRVASQQRLTVAPILPVAQASLGVLWALDGERQLLLVVDCAGQAADGTLAPLPLAERSRAWRAEYASPLVWAGLDEPPPLARLLGPQLAAALCLPISVDRALWGVLVLARLAHEPPFDSHNAAVARMAAEQIALQIVTLRLRNQLDQRRRWSNSLEDQLAQSNKMASLGVMASGIAHELRNPLGIITSNAQLLDEHPDDSELRHMCVQKICTAARRASRIIDNLLHFAHPQSKWTHVVDLRVLLDETLLALDQQLAAQWVRVNHHVEPDLPPIRGNAELLQQVFTNLIHNACNAMTGGGVLTIRACRHASGAAELQFSDTGCGIAPENLPKVFDPFFTTMPVGSGTGLGLAISYRIVQQHQGLIEVVSEVDRGTTFTMRLPAVAADV